MGRGPFLWATRCSRYGERSCINKRSRGGGVHGVTGFGRHEPAREHELAGSLDGRVELGDRRESRLLSGVVLVRGAGILGAGCVKDGDHVLGHG